MGACIRINRESSKSSLLVVTTIKNTYDYDLSLITKSHFYFLLRKEVYLRLKNENNIGIQFIDLRPALQYSESHNILSTNLDRIASLDSSIKVLYDLRTLVLADDTLKEQNDPLNTSTVTLLNKLKEFRIKPSKVYILRSSIKEFLKEYPYFQDKQAKSNLQASLFLKLNFPLLVFSSDDLIPANPRKIKIYIHNSKSFNSNNKAQPTFYQQVIGIKQTLTIKDDFDEIQEENQKKLQPKLEKFQSELLQTKSSSVLIIHNHLQNQDQILKFVLRFVCETYNVEYSRGLQYFGEKFLTLNRKVTEKEKIEAIWQAPEETKTEKKIQSMTKTEEFEYYIQKYYKECKSDKRVFNTEKVVSLLTMLLDNLTKSNDPQPFRNIKTTNPQLGQYLFKYENGRKLLQAIGFFQQKGINMYRNDLQQKYLKGYQVDMGLAFKNFQLSKQK